MEPHHDPRPIPDILPAWERDPRVRRALASALGSAQGHDDTEAALERLLDARKARDTSTVLRSKVPKRSTSFSWGALRVGVLIFALCISGVKARDFFRAPHRVMPERVYVTHRGQQATVTLPDGSQAILAPETDVRYSTDAQGGRTIQLHGEAFFTVTPDAQHPFVVRHGGIAVRVLGTSFAVRRYATDRAVQVAVMSGRVAASGRGIPMILSAGAVGELTDSSAVVNTRQDAESMTAWTHGTLVFRDTPVPVMLEAAGRWLGYTFRLGDSTFAKQYVSVTLRANQPSEAMRTIETILGATMAFEGNVVTLRAESAASQKHRSKLRTPRDSFFVHPAVEVGK